ncbi:MAG: formamidopyrimidine-DNA glycosylase [Pseudomonadales bacterium]|nr:formamidopyrimidine-DNA glycosylase [Pseudomonadales bacterium]
MPEMPDLEVYRKALETRTAGSELVGIRLANPFVLRSVEPTIEELTGQRVVRISRLAKRLVVELEDECFIAIHLMIAGRLHWIPPGKRAGRSPLITFDFDSGTLTMTEAGKKRRASVHLVRGADSLAELDPGGLEIFDISADEFRACLASENHTLKRSLTDQRFLAGIGNAYSDEILHHARLSPMRQIRQLADDEWLSLFESCKSVLKAWIERLDQKAGNEFPEKVTAFHEEMAVHGKYKQPCVDCGNPIQRIRYATNECNYCAYCQNQGNLLADRSLSRLLKKDWPRKLEELG